VSDQSSPASDDAANERFLEDSLHDRVVLREVLDHALPAFLGSLREEGLDDLGRAVCFLAAPTEFVREVHERDVGPKDLGGLDKCLPSIPGLVEDVAVD
jgi:hypothetical protein